MMNFKAIVTVIFSAVLMFCLTACKDTPKSADNSSPQPVAVSDTVTTTSTTTTAATTTTGTKRKTTTTTTTSAATTQTTLVTTVTTVPTTTTALATTVTTTTTTSAVTTSTAAVTTTTTVATTTPKAVVTPSQTGLEASVRIPGYEDISNTWDYLPEGDMNETLWAYLNLAMYGQLTDEIRQIITDDIMNYAIAKYDVHINDDLYFNSSEDYYCSFATGAKNGDYLPYSLEELDLMESWGLDVTVYRNATLADYARGFRQGAYEAADYTYEVYGSQGIGASVVFAYIGSIDSTNNTNYSNYQVSFCVG